MALALAAVGFAQALPNVDSISVALRITGRWSFLLFWMAYSGSAIATLLGPAFAPFFRRSREFGLAFAAAHLVHIGLVIWLYRILHHAPLSESLVVFFSIGTFWAYLLAVFSFGRLSRFLGLRLWRALRLLGSHYILLAFAKDFVPPVVHFGSAAHDFLSLIGYVPFAAMCIVGPLLRISAEMHRQWDVQQVRVP